MTAALPARLQEIRDTLEETTKLGEWETTRANDVVIYDPNGFGAYRIIAHAPVKEDAAFIASAPVTVAKLLGAVEAVLAECDAMDEAEAAYSRVGAATSWRATRIRRALTDALGEK